MKKHLPARITTPQELFYFLHSLVTYKNDPDNNELLQSPKSLFQKNYHGIPGAGDCDCFTILTISAAKALHFKNIEIVLAGRNNKEAVHIWTKIAGKNFDLTCAFFGESRKYAYLQTIPLSKFKWQDQ